MSKKVRGLIKQGHRFCAYCGIDTVARLGTKNTMRKPSADHFYPRSFGGRDTPDNIVMACRLCNLKKGQQIWPVNYNTKTGDHIFMKLCLTTIT